ncbi:NUDIX hydrolase [Fusibacter sp. JL216-2]|uniref:NUDIX hydrolase n=1 Tax=Fusibacter sp. JL216-2 TaxID=3071453 RepID=UPI003D3337D1
MSLEFDIHIGFQEELNLPKMERVAVRAIIMRNQEILLLSSNRGDYKLPGGGVKNEEDFEKALEREVKEETGYCKLGGTRKIGIVKEKKLDDFDKNRVFEMTSHYYECDVIGEKEAQELDVYEAELGFIPKWVNINKAIELNEKYIENHPDKPGWAKRENLVFKIIRDIRCGLNE